MATFISKSLGCRVNKAEVNHVADTLTSCGHIEVSEGVSADFLVINTCCVTNEAVAKTRKQLRQLLAKNPSAHLFVMGCAARLYADELARLDTTRLHVVQTTDALLEQVVSRYTDTPTDHAPNDLTYSRANIKIQDGCNHRCTYCCVWQARGPACSISPADAVFRVQELVTRNTPEIILCGIDVGSYAHSGMTLAKLLEELLAKTDAKRFRLSSIEPQSLTPELIDVIAHNPTRVASYLHIPLQSGSDSVLSNMNREYCAKAYLETTQMAKEHIPGLALSTDIIVGFPGETPAQFEETCDLVEAVGFSNLHVFRYSARKNTPAAGFSHQVPKKTKRERSARLIALGKQYKEAYANSLVGTTVTPALRTPTAGIDEHLLEVELTTPTQSNLLQARVIENRGTTLLAEPCKKEE